jgi:hypothetical protein
MNKVKQQPNSTATSILTTKYIYRSLSAQRLSERTVVKLLVFVGFNSTSYATWPIWEGDKTILNTDFVARNKHLIKSMKVI